MAKHFGRELWDRMREFVGREGPPYYDCGDWTIRKLFFLCQYLATTTRTIVGNRKFTSINYVDLFSGPGVCSVLEDGRRKLYPGSPLLAAGCVKPFDNIYLVEQSSERLDALRDRIERLDTASRMHYWCDDANAVAPELAQLLPLGSLTVAFIDPYSLDIHFESIRLLAEARPLDLIILFSDAMDVMRNVEAYYYPAKSDKLDLFLGPRSEWRKKWDQLTDRAGPKCCDFFGDVYLDQLLSLGYKYSRRMPIRGDSGRLYSLVYASKHPLGLKFWDAASREELGGTKTFWD